MAIPIQYHFALRARHLRYLFFIDENASLEYLHKLIKTNQSIWGGKYNPIVPVKDNKISSNYIEIIKHYDPDFIGYSSSINFKTITDLNLFTPCKYFNLDEPSENQIYGISTKYFEKKEIPAIIKETSKTLINFCEVNFGVTSETYSLQREQQERIFTMDTSYNSSIFEFINKRRPQILSTLSSKNLNTTILRDEHNSTRNFEIIISKKNGTIQDLLYFWNRQLFCGNDSALNQIYVTEIELEELLKDKFFGNLLYIFSQRNQNILDVSSFSLSENDIEEIINTKLRPFNKYISFNRKKKFQFPFEVLDASGLYERNLSETIIRQTLPTEKGLIYFPNLSFNSNVQHGKWVVDIEIEKVDEYNRHGEQFSLRTEHQYYFNLEGRINKRHNISLFVNSSNQTLEIKIPSFISRLNQIISSPKIHTKSIDSAYRFIRIGDIGARISAFIKLFQEEFHMIEDFFDDKFWFDLFYSLSSNTKTEGSTITFSELKKQCIERMNSDGITLNLNSHQNEKNLEYGLKSTLDELCERKIFFMGFNVKCSECSSKFWYGISEAEHEIICKGCHAKNMLSSETPFSYKLNDLVKNNICRVDDRGKIHPDGNLTLIKTLLSLHRKSRSSFNFSPQLDLYPDPQPGTQPMTDLDIVCEVDGKLYLGEAKYSSDAFEANGHKSLNNLIDIAKAILPDIIMISCTDDAQNKLDKKTEYLKHNLKGLPIEIIGYKTYEPTYRFSSHRYFYD